MKIHLVSPLSGKNPDPWYGLTSCGRKMYVHTRDSQGIVTRVIVDDSKKSSVTCEACKKSNRKDILQRHARKLKHQALELMGLYIIEHNISKKEMLEIWKKSAVKQIIES